MLFQATCSIIMAWTYISFIQDALNVFPAYIVAFPIIIRYLDKMFKVLVRIVSSDSSNFMIQKVRSLLN